jgi:uncharacterized membrane protein YczE
MGTAEHGRGIAVKIVVAVPTIEGVVPTIGLAGYGTGIAVERVVTCKAIDGLILAIAKHTGVAEQGIVT